MPKEKNTQAAPMEYEVLNVPNERYQQQVAAREEAEKKDATPKKES
jgi:hypothetical protein